jgi:hypothetical protein
MLDSTRAEKSFDCVEFKRQAQLRIYERIKNMSPAEEIEYFRRQAETGPFADLVARIEDGKSRAENPQQLKEGQFTGSSDARVDSERQVG